MNELLSVGVPWGLIAWVLLCVALGYGAPYVASRHVKRRMAEEAARLEPVARFGPYQVTVYLQHADGRSAVVSGAMGWSNRQFNQLLRNQPVKAVRISIDYETAVDAERKQ